jgi:hypothetical protein
MDFLGVSPEGPLALYQKWRTINSFAFGGVQASTDWELIKEHAWGGNVTQSKCVSNLFATANTSMGFGSMRLAA